MQKRRACFYFTNTTDIQEYTGLILECVRVDLFVDIMVFDITTKKRNFYYYTANDFENYFDCLFESNGLEKNYSIRKYTHREQSSYLEDYNNINPDFVFTRSAKSIKHALWTPIMDKSKTIMFLWGDFESHEKYHNLLTIARYKDNAAGFANNRSIFVPKKNIRYMGKNHQPFLDPAVLDFAKKQKTCFIPETWARNLEDKNNNLPLILEVIDSLKSMGYHIAYKMREKGYPAQVEYEKNYVREVEPLVDLMITKDLNYPSSLYYLMEHCDMTCIFNVTTTIVDALYLSRNPFVFLSKHLSARYRSKLADNNPLSWGPSYKYENLMHNANLYDEKNNTSTAREFLIMHEKVIREKNESSSILFGNPHEKLINKILNLRYNI